MTRVDEITHEFNAAKPSATPDLSHPASPDRPNGGPALVPSVPVAAPPSTSAEALQARPETTPATTDAAHESLPQLARNAAHTWLRAAGWTAGTSLRVSGRLRRLAADPAAAQLMVEEVREAAREFLGVSELEAEVRAIAPLLGAGGTLVPTRESLQAQGERLLRAAADVGFDEVAHPAFARILTEIDPDEARILRLLALEGPQPMVDIRAGALIGGGSQLIAQGLTMIAAQAGLRWRDRMPVYLANLSRLHLVETAQDPLERPVAYQLLEAQPDVLALLRDTPRSRTVRRRLALTGLGTEFCRTCLPLSVALLESGPPP